MNGPVSPQKTPARDVTGGKAKSISRHGNLWQFSMPDICQNTPSCLETVPTKLEMIQRAKGVNFIIQVGMQLNVPQMTIYAAATFLHRFYMRFSTKRFHYYDIAGSCLFLATKVEESNRRLRDVAIACTKVASKKPNMVVDEQSEDYWRWRETIIYDEELVLEAVCFDLSLESPYEYLMKMLDKFEMGRVDRFRRTARGFINDSCRTTLCLVFSAKIIAAAGVHWASTSCNIPVEYDPPWYEAVDINLQDIQETCNLMADLYSSLKEAIPSLDTGLSYTRVTAIKGKRKHQDGQEVNYDDQQINVKVPKLDEVPQ
jgi:protein BUR2